MKIEIEETNNGYWVILDGKKYSYTSVEQTKMFEELGKSIFGYKIKVERR